MCGGCHDLKVVIAFDKAAFDETVGGLEAKFLADLTLTPNPNPNPNPNRNPDPNPVTRRSSLPTLPPSRASPPSRPRRIPS